MAAFIIYIIRWAVSLTLLYSLFGLFLKRETLHSVNRSVLLFVLAASMILPLIQISTKETNIVTQGREAIEMRISEVELLASPHDEKEPATQTNGGNTFSPQGGTEGGLIAILALLLIYAAGLLVCWMRYFWQMAALVLMIRSSKRIETVNVPSRVHVVTHPSVTAPCSWMRWILLNPADVNIRPIMQHELAHIRLAHSWDMLLAELTCRMLWFLPFAWMLRQDLRDVHEYQADQHVLRSGISDEEYQMLLVKKATSARLQPVVNAFNQSPIKRRFQMMFRKPSRRWVALKAVYLLPLCALALVAFAQPQLMGDIERQVYNFADANLVRADLKSWTSTGDMAIDADQKHDVTEVLDSVMTAIGARKTGDGVYVGGFKPTLSSDTVYIADAVLLNRRSAVTARRTFHPDRDGACNIALMKATRRDETGYYIRQLTPASLAEYDVATLDVPVSRKYDQRPVNKRPKLERPAWPDYDLHNDRSFAAYSDIQTAPEGQGHFVEMEKGDLQNGRFTLYRCQDATYVAYDRKIPWQQDWFFYRWMDGSKIIDADTGDQYMIRRLEHFPLNQCFWIYGQAGQTIRIVAVYPPLPLSVKRIRLHEADGPSRKWFAGMGYTSKPYRVNDLRPLPPKQQGRVIY